MKSPIACVAAVCLFVLNAMAQDSTQHEHEFGVREEFEQLKGAVESLQESSTEMRGVLDALRKIKLSGYIQAQYRATDIVNQPFSIGQFAGGTFPSNQKSQFQIRRGRIRVAYDNVLTQFVLQMDFLPTGVTLKDAFFSLTEPWLQSFGIQMGAFNRPFGYELAYSSASRESPERSRMFQTLFPGERDLGAKVFFAPQVGSLTWLRCDLGLFNGTGANANEFDNFKDIIGRVGAQIPFEDENAALDVGASVYFGNVRNDTKFLFVNGSPHNAGKGFVLDSALANVGKGVTRRYIGGDLQFYYDIPSIGGAIVRAELIAGVQPGTSATSVSPAAQPNGALYKRDFNGWYINYIQNIGDHDQFVVKYDVYDPNTNVQASDFAPGSNLTVADIKYSTLGFGLIHHWDANTKFLLYYDIVTNEELDATKIPSTSSLFPYTGNVRDNVLTFRAQYRF